MKLSQEETYVDSELARELGTTNPDTKMAEFIKKHRFSALVDGICMGIGFVFLMLGIVMPMLMAEQMIPGLMLVIGAILCLVAGAIIEVYHWAKLD
jgi:hypothetical protein